MNWFFNSFGLVFGVLFGVFCFLFLMIFISYIGGKKEDEKLKDYWKDKNNTNDTFVAGNVCVKQTCGVTIIKTGRNIIVIEKNGDITVNDKKVEV